MILILYIIELMMIKNYLTYASYYGRPLIDGSKFAFIQAPYANTVKIQKDTAVQDDIVSVRWPSGIVRYYVDEKSYDDTFDVHLKTAIQIIQRSSCIKFTRLSEKSTDNITWIHITNPGKDRKCIHEPSFMDSGEIILVFGYDCLKTNELLHTLLHGIGVKDEVTHPHRDKYIRVLWDNIQPAYRHLYHKQAEIQSKTLVEYDPLSVMQFHDRAFSKNGRATIAPLESGLLISPSETLSQLDKMRLNMYFGHECNKRKVSNILQTCKKSLKYVEKDDEPDGEDEKVTSNGDENEGDRNPKVETANDEDVKIVSVETITNHPGHRVKFVEGEIIVISDEVNEKDDDRQYENKVEEHTAQYDGELEEKRSDEVGEEKTEQHETREEDVSQTKDNSEQRKLAYSESDAEENKESTYIEKSTEEVINKDTGRTGEKKLNSAKKQLHESVFGNNVTDNTRKNVKEANETKNGNEDRNTVGAYNKSSESDIESNITKNLV